MLDTRRQRTVGRLRYCGVAAIAAVAITGSGSPASAAEFGSPFSMDQGVQEVRSTPAGDFGLKHPGGIAYGGRKSLIVAQQGRRVTRLVRLSLDGSRRGAVRVFPRGRASTLTAGVPGRRLAVAGRNALLTIASNSRRLAPATGRIHVPGLRLHDVHGATYDARSRTWYILDAGSRAIVRVPMRGGRAGTPSRISLARVHTRGLRGIAVSPDDHLLYVGSPRTQQLLTIDGRGRVRRTRSLRSLHIADLRGMSFAPSADPTDDPSVDHLYIADAGGEGRIGRVVESTIDPKLALAAAAAPTVTGNQVQVIQTSSFSPPAPDAAGITYLPDKDRLLISDSEVDEMTIYQGVNLWTSTRTGVAAPSGTTLKFSKEPAGVGYRASDKTLFVSDDDTDRVTGIQPGPDGQYMTSDDIQVARIDVGVLGDTDPEDVDYDPTSGDLFVADGTGLEVWRIHPVNGIFGDADDVVTHFDVGIYGARDCEGLAIDAQRNTILTVDPSTKALYEFSMSGALIRKIDLSHVGITNRAYADVTLAPTSNPNDSPSAMNYWVADRQVDNGEDPNENDGKVYEVTLDAADALPTVAFTAPAAGANVSGTVALTASATDDVGVTSVAFSVDGTLVGTDSNGSDGWSASWNTANANDGVHTLTATATDTAGQVATTTRSVTVDNFDAPPSVSITQPAAAAAVSGTVTIRASAGDDRGISGVQFAVDGTTLSTDTDGADGWTATWDTTTTTGGGHTLTAAATDTTNQTTTAVADVTVDNVPPAVNVIAPPDGAVLSGTATLTATATDDRSVASVQFLVDGEDVGNDQDGANGWSVAWDTTTASNGAHSVTALARDTAGNATTSTAVAVTTDNSSVTIDRPVQVGADDVDEVQDGTVTRTGGDIELGTDHGIPTTNGLRFAGLAIPAGSTISSAYVQFTVDETGKDATSLLFKAQSADDAPPFTTAAFSVSSRTRTTNSVSWTPPQWLTLEAAGSDQRTPDLSAVLQEVVNRPGWTSGNALAILITGSGRRTAESFEGGFPPRLHVEFRPPTGPPANTVAPTVTGTAKQGQTLTATPGTWTGSPPIDYTYQWQSCDSSGTGCTDVDGETTMTYRIRTQDVGKTLRVQVTASNSAGSTTASSALTAVVVAEPTDGLTQIADSLTGSSDPTYYASNHRVAVTSGGRMLVVYGRHTQGVQLAWRDPGGSWQTTTRGQVANGLLLGGTGTGDWSASIALAKDQSGTQRAWVVWASAGTGSTTKALQIRRLSALDDPGGPLVESATTLDTPENSPARPDIAFERAPDGSYRGAVTWVRRASTTQFQLVAGWFTDLTSATTTLSDVTALVTSTSQSRNGTLVSSIGGLQVVGRSTSDKLQRFRHDATAPLGNWTASSTGVSTVAGSLPSAVNLSSGTVLAATESNTTTHMVTVQRFTAAGAASIDLQLTGYAMPTLVTDGDNAWLVMIRQSDGFIVSRSFSPTSGWSTTDRQEIGAEGGGNYAWPNALREADGRLRFIVRGPAGATQQDAVLAYQRLL